MIRLKNVSKFYYSKGVIATGFTKVNLEFNIGEFVAITGESGSGKSTLLNVISGLDSYEEGEMYVDNKETSHFIEKDWEDYRRKNIGNIYQNFNLINSYTVYQNIDLVLSLNGVPESKRNIRIRNLLKRVDMLRYKNTKVSKLSGGQKQRVAIARALAKDTPVIIADEPTGSLDKRSAANIIRLLKEISEDKLVIIVTHNFEQVKDFITRKVTMHDGKIIEDIKISDVNKDQLRKVHEYRNINFIDKNILGFRNAFNVLSKFLLLFFVYSFIVCALMGEYSVFKRSEYEASKSGMNSVFLNTDDHRVVLNKKDKSAFSEEEIDNIKNMDNVNYVMENDAIVDKIFSIENSENDMYQFAGVLASLDMFDDSVDVGRLPEAENEIIIEGAKEELIDYKNKLINHTFYMSSGDDVDRSHEYVVVGIKYSGDNIPSAADCRFYLSEQSLDDLLFKTHQQYSTVVVDFMGTNHISSNSAPNFRLEVNSGVSLGSAIVSEDFEVYCDQMICKNKLFTVNVNNMYYTDSKNFVIEKIYNKDNINNLLDLPGYTKDNYEEFYNGIIYVNPLDYNDLFNKGTYQMSIYVDDIENIDETVSYLEDNGYHTLMIKDTLVDSDSTAVVRAVKFVVTILLVAVLFFISYFIIRIILKSRSSYYSVLRMLGASKRVCTELLIIELFVISNLSYFIFIIIAEINKTDLLNIGFIDTVNRYFKFNDYIILYLILIFMSLLISISYAGKLFKSSVMSTYREEG